MSFSMSRFANELENQAITFLIISDATFFSGNYGGIFPL